MPLRSEMEMSSPKGELGTLAGAPGNGSDLTKQLPDELMEMIILRVPFEALWNGVCERVCQRWERIVRDSTAVERRKRDGKWAAYEAGTIGPRIISPETVYNYHK